MRSCSRCGEQASPSDAFCSHCGERLSQAEGGGSPGDISSEGRGSTLPIEGNGEEGPAESQPPAPGNKGERGTLGKRKRVLFCLLAVLGLTTASALGYFFARGDGSTVGGSDRTFTGLTAAQMQAALLAEEDLPGGADIWRHDTEDLSTLQWDWLEDCYNLLEDAELAEPAADAESRYVTSFAHGMVFHSVVSFATEVEAQAVLATLRARLGGCTTSDSTNPLGLGETASLSISVGGSSGAKSADETLVLTGGGSSQGDDGEEPVAAIATLDVARFGGTIVLVQSQTVSGGPSVRPQELAAQAEEKLITAAGGVDE